MNKNIITCIVLLLTLMSFSQTKSISKKELRKNRPTYLGVTMGFNSSNFRDFATSPLFYNGIQTHIALARIKNNSNRESEIGLSYSSGNYNNTFNDHVAESKGRTLSLFYSQLYNIKKESSDNLNIMVGGMLNTTANLRINKSLQNNAYGIENFTNLFGSIKITKNVSRKKDKDKRFLFINYHLKKRTRKLSYRLNVGILNTSYRNGYAYIDQSSILNNPNLFDGYHFKLSGSRLSSTLDYTISLANKNKIQLSYLWDAYKTGGDVDVFEMAHHTFKITFLFNTNSK